MSSMSQPTAKTANSQKTATTRMMRTITTEKVSRDRESVNRCISA